MVDFEFISQLEGGQKTKGYVPDPDGSKSGITIATGVDLGQRSVQDIEYLDIPDSLKVKLKLYIGKKGKEAQQYLKNNPLEITTQEAKALDISVKQAFLKSLEKKYNAATQKKPFSQLLPEAQTVIASVAFQYGDLSKKTPKFWNYAINQDWQNVINELKNFGDKYPTRRKKEAELLEKVIPPQTKESNSAQIDKKKPQMN